MPPPRLRFSAVCSVWLGGKVVRRANELPTHKYTAAGDAGAIYHDWKPLLCPPLLARHSLTPPEQGELTQLEQHQIELFQMGCVRGGGFHLDCGSPGVCELLVDKHGRICFVLGVIQASDHRQSATVKANTQMTTVNYVCRTEMKIRGDVKYIFLPLSHRLKLKHLPSGVFVYTFSGCASEFM